MYIKIPDLSFIIIDINVFNGYDYISYLDYDVYSVGPVTPPPILLSQSQNDLQTICINNFEKKIPICLLSFASISFEVGPILDFEFSRPLL